MDKLLNVDLMGGEEVIHPVIGSHMNHYSGWDSEYCSDWYRGSQYKGIYNSFVSTKKTKTITHVDHGGQKSYGYNIFFNDYKDYADYYSKLPKNVRRDINISEKSKLYFKEMNFMNHLPDIQTIHNENKERIHSLKTPGMTGEYAYRGGNKFNENYIDIFNKIELPSSLLSDRVVADPLHCTKWYCIFRYLKHYRQGEVITNEKLVAYSAIHLDGEVSSVGFIWGSPKFHSYGIMFNLITSIVKNLMDGGRIKCLNYAKSGIPDLQRWKERMLFNKSYIMVNKF